MVDTREGDPPAKQAASARRSGAFNFPGIDDRTTSDGDALAGAPKGVFRDDVTGVG